MPRKDTDSARQPPTDLQIKDLRETMLAAGENPPAEKESFRLWLKKSAEKELWFLSRWLLGNDWLGLGTFHREVVCPFLTNLRGSRSKLLMLPMGHLKSTIVSRSMPIHILIQPLGSNLYFPRRAGANLRIALVNENETKSMENLSYIRQHLENNEWLYWCWPDVIWANKKERGSARWSDQFLDVRRNEYWAEASVTAIGVNTGFIGRYFDVILPDDIAALQASQSKDLLARAKTFRRAMRTRRVDKTEGPTGSIIIGVGTEWPAVDLYEEWQKDPTVNVMVKSIVEVDEKTKEERSLWPEKYPLEIIEKMREENDAVEWAAWYMNRRVGRGVTALSWEQLREYKVSEDGLYLEFPEIAEIDALITARRARIDQNIKGFRTTTERYDPMKAKPRLKLPQGMDSDYALFMRMKYGRCLKCGAAPAEGGFACGHEQVEEDATSRYQRPLAH